MVRLALSILALAVFAFFQSCGPETIPCMRVSSTEITETRDIKDFKGIAIYVPADLIITQGPEYEIKLTGPDNVIEATKTSLSDDYLMVSTSDCFNGSYDLTIEITAPTYDLINISEFGTLRTTTTIVGGHIQLEFLGDIGVNATLEMDSIFTTFVGRGDLIFNGSTTYHELLLEGEFEVNGFNLLSDHTAIDLLGVGDCEIFANDKLDVSIQGTGNVYYRGTPSIDSEITGIGEIINAN
jgi:hypothetical protein